MKINFGFNFSLFQHLSAAWCRVQQSFSFLALDSSRTKKMSKIFKILIAICFGIIFFSMIGFYLIWGNEKPPISNLERKIAVLYASPTFHEEVVSTMACTLHDSGYYVV